MNWYDEIRVRGRITQNKMRDDFAKFLVKVLRRMAPAVFNKCVIDKKIVFDISQYTPLDNKWHHYAFTVDFYAKHDKKRKKKKVKLACYFDGKRKRVKHGKKSRVLLR